jgi:hypothetical protein
MALLSGACEIPAGRFRGSGTYDVPPGESSIEKPKPAPGRRVGHDVRHTSRARRGKSRPLWLSLAGRYATTYRDGDLAMSLIRNGYPVSTRRGFLGVLFSALLTLALFGTGAAIAQEVKQIKLTEKRIQGFMAASKDIAKLYDRADPDKPDPKVEAQAGAIAKKSGFASLAEYEDVSMNIAMIMYGIDPQTKKFTDPPEQIKKEIAALKGDKSVPESEKREDLAQLEAALKDAKPVQFKENIALVLKYLDQLVPFVQEQDLKLRPAD